MNEKPSDYRLQLGQELGGKLGTDFRVNLHDGTEDVAALHVFSISNQPAKGVYTFASLGMSERPVFDAQGQNYYRELISGCRESPADFEDVFAGAVVTCEEIRSICGPPRVLMRNAFRGLSSDHTVIHGLFCDPLPWIRLQRPSEIEGRQIHWRYLLPILDDEWNYCVQHGHDAFLSRLYRPSIDWFDLNRASVI